MQHLRALSTAQAALATHEHIKNLAYIRSNIIRSGDQPFLFLFGKPKTKQKDTLNTRITLFLKKNIIIFVFWRVMCFGYFVFWIF